MYIVHNYVEMWKNIYCINIYFFYLYSKYSCFCLKINKNIIKKLCKIIIRIKKINNTKNGKLFKNFYFKLIFY